MSIEKTVFLMLANSTRDWTSKDVEVRAPVENVDRVLRELRQRGLIEPTGRQKVGKRHYETTYRVVAGAKPPEDMRSSSDRLSAAHLKRQKQSLAARARAIRTLKKQGAR